MYDRVCGGTGHILVFRADGGCPQSGLRVRFRGNVIDSDRVRSMEHDDDSCSGGRMSVPESFQSIWGRKVGRGIAFLGTEQAPIMKTAVLGMGGPAVGEIEGRWSIGVGNSEDSEVLIG